MLVRKPSRPYRVQIIVFPCQASAHVARDCHPGIGVDTCIAARCPAAELAPLAGLIPSYVVPLDLSDCQGTVFLYLSTHPGTYLAYLGRYGVHPPCHIPT